MQGTTKNTHWGKVWLAGALAWLCSTTALTGESPFEWVYTVDVVPKGRFEFEYQSLLQRGRSRRSYSGLLSHEEVEYGVTDKFQLAGYFNWSYVNANRNGLDGTTRGPLTDLGPDGNPTEHYRKTRFGTVSLEAIYQLMNPVADPIGLALYIEPELGPRKCDLEWRIVLQKNWSDDRFILAVNILSTRERDKTVMDDIERTFILDLTAGMSYRLTDNLNLGMKACNHREFQGYRYNRRGHSARFLSPSLYYATKR